jgi:hypothetical protein
MTWETILKRQGKIPSSLKKQKMFLEVIGPLYLNLES